MKTIKRIGTKHNVDEFEISSFSEFQNLIVRNKGFNGYLFRGQMYSSWKLEPSIYRFKNHTPAFIAENMESILENFKIYARGSLNELQSLPDDPDEIWAIGQHFGLYTPLLDWSVSPYIAMYFALSEEGKIPRDPIGDDFSIYLLNAKVLNQLYYEAIYNKLSAHPKTRKYNISGIVRLKASDEMKGRMIESVAFIKAMTIHQIGLQLEYKALAEEKLRIFSPKFGGNQRLLNQRGIFTIASTYPNIETAAAGCYPGKKILSKINFPGKIRSDAIEMLNAMNINSMTMFPDLSGAAKYANSKGISDIGITGMIKKLIP